MSMIDVGLYEPEIMTLIITYYASYHDIIGRPYINLHEEFISVRVYSPFSNIKSANYKFGSMESKSSHQLFVYSSLRNGFHNDTYNYVTQFFAFVCDAKTEGILSDLGDLVVATPGSDNTFIKGELYKLNNENDFSWVFGQLDDYEGLVVTMDEQLLRRRALTKVFKDDGTVTDAWIYWYIGDVSEKPVIDSGDILKFQDSKKL